MPTAAVHEIDLLPFREGGEEGRRRVVAAVDAACSDSGFLLLRGHGVDPLLCDAVLAAWQEFFDLPEDEKLRSVVDDHAANIGYSAYGTEALAYTTGGESPPDLMEAFSIAREDVLGPEYDSVRAWFTPNIWPARPEGLREVSLAYYAAMRDVIDVMGRAMSLALGLPEGWMSERNERAVITLRPINYERRPGAPDVLPEQMRLGAHTDFGVFTLLLADEEPGLQVLRHGVWHDLVPPRGTLVCNLGDMLAMWTNDRWTSTMHRVVPPVAESDGSSRRRSLACFVDGDPAVTIECIPSCTSAGNPPRYPAVQAGEWLTAKIVGNRLNEVPDLPGDGLTSAATR
jgi:isopenicillin N synthase-like dioxygenase